MDLNSFTTYINHKNHTFFTICPNLNKIAKENITKIDNSSDEHLWIFGVCLLDCKCYIFDKVNNLFLRPFQFYTYENIKTLGIIFFIFGFNFIILYNYPLCFSGNEERKNYLKSRRTIYLIYCFRLAPAIILSTSGYSLVHKFLNFLDKKLANIIPDGSFPLNNEENNKENANNK